MPPERIAEKQTEMQAEKLKLNEEQANKLKAINLKYAKRMQSEKKNLQNSKKESVAQMKELNTAQNEEVKAILSEEQYKNYLMLKKQNRTQMRTRLSEKIEKKQQMRQDRMEALNLSEEQKEQFQDIKLKYGEKMRAVKQKGRSEENRKEMTQLMDAMDEEVKQILSKEQFKAYLKVKSEGQEMRKSKMRRMKN
jgi:hypothetical protein